MNVLQLICPTGFYGAERWILALAHNASDAGFRCDLAVTSEPPHEPLELLDRYPSSAGMSQRLQMRHRFDWSVLDNLIKIIRDNDIDIIHSHGYKSDIIGYLAARKAGIRMIATAHGYTRVTSLKDRSYHLLGNACLRRADRVVPLSSELVREVSSRGVDAARITLIGNGVDTDEIDEVRAQFDPQIRVGNSQRIGYVGQLVKRKRVHLMIRTFEKLWLKDKNRTLDLVGDGAERPALELLASSLSCAKAITFHGFVSERLQTMATFDVMLMTSEAEGVPRTLMEAMTLGVPCAAFAIPGVDELIEHGESGLLAINGDVEDLYRCCDTILCDSTEAARLSKNARARVLEHFSAKGMAQRYATLFTEVINQDSMAGRDSASRAKKSDDAI